MTVSTTKSVAVLLGNGVTTSFPVDVKFLDNADMVVTITDPDNNVSSLVEGTGDGEYQLTGAGDDNGGTLVYPQGAGTTLPDGWAITVSRIVPIVQELDLTNQSGFFLETIEATFDNVVMMIQQVDDDDNFAALRKNATDLYFDAKSERIANIAEPTEANDAARLTDLSDLEARFLADSEVAFTYWNIIGTGAQDYDIAGATTSEAGAYDVLLDNVRQRAEIDYTINIGATPPQINFTSPVNNPVDIYILARGYNSQVVGGSAGSWNDLTDKPTTFPPDAHTHDFSGSFASISHSHAAGDLPDGTTAAKGIVQLSSSLTNTSTTVAATASAVKTLKDLIDGGGTTLPEASTTVAGIVQLENAINSTSLIKAPTSAAVKAAYDHADIGVTSAAAAQSTADAAQSDATTAIANAATAQSTANGKADMAHNHDAVYAPLITVTSSTSTSAPSSSGRSEGDEHYIY